MTNPISDAEESIKRAEQQLELAREQLERAKTVVIDQTLNDIHAAFHFAWYNVQSVRYSPYSYDKGDVYIELNPSSTIGFNGPAPVLAKLGWYLYSIEKHDKQNLPHLLILRKI